VNNTYIAFYPTCTCQLRSLSFVFMTRIAYHKLSTSHDLFFFSLKRQLVLLVSPFLLRKRYLYRMPNDHRFILEGLGEIVIGYLMTTPQNVSLFMESFVVF
jgi:hypothetical protein